ncbi:MAG TPA: DMT family transporter [Stellaceae bacterium]|nr:DMT family transporter [Stellaceae bacterium]
MNPARAWRAALAAVVGSVMVGFMPLLARRLYAAGIDPASMLLWRYAIALPALLIAAAAMRVDLLIAWRRGAWKIALVGATLGVGQTITFWESIKTLDTSLAVLLFYTYPALMLVVDRVLFKRPIRKGAALCVAVILAGAAFIAVPGLRGGTIDLRGLAWAIPSPLVYVFYLAANSVLLRQQQPLTGAICLYLGMAASFAAIDLVTGLDVPRGAYAWALMIIAGLGPGALVITLFSYSVPLLGPSSYAIIANMELVTVVAVGVTLLGEKLTPARIGGGVLIVAGILGYGLLRKPAGAPLLPPLLKKRQARRRVRASG